MSNERGSEALSKGPYEPLRDGEKKRVYSLQEEPTFSTQHNALLQSLWKYLKKHLAIILIVIVIILFITLVIVATQKQNGKPCNKSTSPCQGKSMNKLFPDIDYAMYGFNILSVSYTHLTLPTICSV